MSHTAPVKDRVITDLARLKSICRANNGRADFYILGECGRRSMTIRLHDCGWVSLMSKKWTGYTTDAGMLKHTGIGAAIQKGQLHWYGF